MALFVNREQQRTQLQEKLAADLKNKLNTANIKAEDTPPAILENDHQTRPAGMVIAVLLAVLVLAVISYVVFVK
jgi:hypothetical protein